MLSMLSIDLSVLSMDNTDTDYPFNFFLNYPYPGLIFVWITDTRFLLWICIHGQHGYTDPNFNVYNK